MADGFFARRCRIDGGQWEGDFDEFFGLRCHGYSCRARRLRFAGVRMSRSAETVCESSGHGRSRLDERSEFDRDGGFVHIHACVVLDHLDLLPRSRR